MKKIIFSISLILSLAGCTTTQVEPMKIGESREYKGMVYTKISDNLTLVKDPVTTNEYVEAYSFSYINSIGASKSLTFSFRNFKEGDTYFLVNSFSNIEFLGDTPRFCRGILFSDGNNAVKLEINNSSRIDDATIVNTKVNKKELEKLLVVFSSNKPITLRVYTNTGSYDLPFSEDSREQIKELLEYSLK